MLMMSFGVFIEEVRVKEFGVAPDANQLVMGFLPVNQFVTNNSTQSSEESEEN